MVLSNLFLTDEYGLNKLQIYPALSSIVFDLLVTELTIFLDLFSISFSVISTSSPCPPCLRTFLSAYHHSYLSSLFVHGTSSSTTSKTAFAMYIFCPVSTSTPQKQTKS